MLHPPLFIALQPWQLAGVVFVPPPVLNNDNNCLTSPELHSGHLTLSLSALEIIISNFFPHWWQMKSNMGILLPRLPIRPLYYPGPVLPGTAGLHWLPLLPEPA